MREGIASLPPLREVIQQHQLSARKALGQHFLLDLNLTDKIARRAGDLTQYHVIEIGPGPGGLTRALLSLGAKKVYAVEKDDRCIAALGPLQNIVGQQLEIIAADALQVVLRDTVPAPRKIVANLPYNVGTLLLLRWLEDIYEDKNAYASLTLMFQKEVADRITAPHGNKTYGRLSVLTQWLCETRTEFDLPPSAFTPPPSVTSSVITLTPRQERFPIDKATLEKVLACAFNQRRKMLRSALKPLGNAESLLEKAGIDPTLRAEQLSVEQFFCLASTYK